MDSHTKSDAGSTRQGRILVGATLGLALSVSSLVFYTIGLFGVPLQHAMGLSRTDLGLATLLATLALSIGAPFAGALADRFGARAVAIPSTIALTAGLALLPLFATSIGGYLLVQSITVALGAGTGAVVYARAIARGFTRRRGLALGIALTGIGISAATVPPLVGKVIVTAGWQRGYLTLAAFAAVGIVNAFFLPREKTPPLAPMPESVTSAATISLGQVASTRAFITLSLAFLVQALSFAGLLPHLVPLLIDAHVPAVRAAGYAGVIGGAVVASRLLAGWLTDIIFAPWIAAVACLLCAAGCACLLVDPVALAVPAAFGLGCAVGTEVDLVGYCTARYFGTASFGRIYGVLYATFLVGSGLSPVWVGAIRDSAGSYHGALAISLAGLCVATLLFVAAPAYPTVVETET